MTPGDIEQAVFELEEVRIVIRAAPNTVLDDYNFVRKAADNSSLNEWLEQRIRPIIRGNSVVVVDGSGNVPHGRTKMATLRASYER